MSSLPLHNPADGFYTAQIDDDFIGRVVQMTARLRDHIERMDNGVPYAVDDLAVVLRAFLHPKPGNDVLRRLSARSGAEAPQVLLSQRPAAKSGGFSVGSIPTRYSGATAHGAAWADINVWSNTTVLEGDIQGVKINFTWAELLNKYANKWGGAHLDEKIPTELMAIDVYAVGGFNLSGYLIRTAAVEVWLAAQYMLSVWAAGHWEKGWSGRAYCPGSIESDPSDLSGRGQLQWFSGNQEEADFLWYIDPLCPYSHLRMMLGGAPCDMQYSSETNTATLSPASSHSEGNYQAPRQMAGPLLSKQGLTEVQMERLSARVLPYPDTKPELWIAGRH